VAVKVRPSPHCAASDLSLSAPRPLNCALIAVPSSVPVAVLAPLRVTTRVLPDCEMERGAFETEEKKSAQGSAAIGEGETGEAEKCPAPDSIFHAPSTENGAVRVRPLFRTATNPSMGSATRRMYASTKLRFECEIAVSPCSGAVPAALTGATTYTCGRNASEVRSPSSLCHGCFSFCSTFETMAFILVRTSGASSS